MSNNGENRLTTGREYCGPGGVLGALTGLKGILADSRPSSLTVLIMVEMLAAWTNVLVVMLTERYPSFGVD